MAFRVTARTLLHLGAELISSDSIALYELVKNGVDAGSKKVTIEVSVRVPWERWHALALQLANRETKAKPGRALETIRRSLLAAIDESAPDSNALRGAIEAAESLDDLTLAWDDANAMLVSDSGTGMSLEMLDDIYLTIGTRFRLEERSATGRVTLGEKGVGRLSAMRLGHRLHVETTRSGESNWNTLDIDWRAFSHASDALVGDIDVSPAEGARKSDRTVSGTRIRITALTSEWTRGKLEDLAREHFSKLSDPFNSRRYPVILRFNDEVLPVPAFARLLLEHAHASVEATFSAGETPGEAPRLAGKVVYREREKVFELDGEQLQSVAGNTSFDTLHALGPFDIRVYWYNRKLLEAIDGIGDRGAVRKLQKDWSGGVMVFRDGFRVLPYAGPEDDWLNIDRRALAASGYKVNRAQLIGRVAITSDANPALTDQTNRQGLRDCPEKQAFVSMLRHLLEVELKTFLDEVDKEATAREPVDLSEVDARVQAEERTIRDHLKALVRRHPALKSEHTAIAAIEAAIGELRRLMTEVEKVAASYDEGRSKLLHLAGVGLMVEILAHELNRATANTLSTLTNRRKEDVASVLSSLEMQLKTLQKRLRVLDPLSTAGRQRKEDFDVVALVREVVSTHHGQFERHRIACALRVEPSAGRSTLTVRAVPGMIVQVLENLIANSVYWLKQSRKLHSEFEPRINIAVNIGERRIAVSDNGPGVDPRRREEIFAAFFTTKPPGQGKGLGLFIAREIAHYHGAKLYLSDHVQAGRKTLNTFVLELGSI